MNGGPETQRIKWLAQCFTEKLGEGDHAARARPQCKVTVSEAVLICGQSVQGNLGF